MADDPASGADQSEERAGSAAPEPPEAGAREPVAAAERSAERLRTEQEPLGPRGRPLDRRSPFFVGMIGAAGVAVTYVLFQLLVAARSVLVLIGLAALLAVGLDPAVTWLTRRRLPRWAA